MNVEHGDSGFIIFRADPASSDEGKPAVGRSSEWIDHCRSRELAERAAAKRATCSKAREVHQELAQAYSQMIRRAGDE